MESNEVVYCYGGQRSLWETLENSLQGCIAYSCARRDNSVNNINA